jgi:hypothetical protein
MYQAANAVEGDDLCLLRGKYKTDNYTLWQKEDFVFISVNI